MGRWKWGIAAAIVAGYFIYAFATLDRRPDDEQIRSIILSAASGAQDENLSKTLADVSPGYKDDSMLNYDRLRMLLMQAFNSEVDFTIEVHIRSIKASGDSATADVQATVAYNEGKVVIYDRGFRLLFKREKHLHAFAFPTTAWRIVGSQGMGLGDPNW